MFLSLGNVECDAKYQNWGGKYQHEIHKPAVDVVLYTLSKMTNVSQSKYMETDKLVELNDCVAGEYTSSKAYTHFYFFYIHFPILLKMTQQ